MARCQDRRECGESASVSRERERERECHSRVPSEALRVSCRVWARSRRRLLPSATRTRRVSGCTRRGLTFLRSDLSLPAGTSSLGAVGPEPPAADLPGSQHAVFGFDFVVAAPPAPPPGAGLPARSAWDAARAARTHPCRRPEERRPSSCRSLIQNYFPRN